MPTRIVRDGINSSARINALSRGADLFYRRLMSVVDDYGRYYGAPRTVLGACWPTKPDAATEAEVENWLQECARGPRPLLTLYEIDGCRYLQLNDFGQRTRSKSKFPDPLSANCGQMSAECGQLTDNCQQPADNWQQPADNCPQSASTSRSRRRNAETETETETARDARGGVTLASDTIAEEWIGVFLAAGVELSEADVMMAYRGTARVKGFLSYSEDERREILRYTVGKATTTSAQYMPAPINLLGREEWKRKGTGRLLPEPVRKSAADLAQERAAARFLAEG